MNDEQFSQLMQAIHEQTEAINRMASVNTALIEAMAEEQDAGEEHAPVRYLDGSSLD